MPTLKLSPSLLALNPHLSTTNGGAVKSPKVAKKGKYGAIKVTIDGIAFDSKKEGSRYCELKLLQRSGEITDLRLQVPFQLSVCKYVADFVYTDKSGKQCVEDVKSKITKNSRPFRIKCKMMKHELGIDIKIT